MNRDTREPSLAELLEDPILHLMMQADGCDPARLAAIIACAGRAVAHGRSGACCSQPLTG